MAAFIKLLVVEEKGTPLVQDGFCLCKAPLAANKAKPENATHCKAAWSSE